MTKEKILELAELYDMECAKLTIFDPAKIDPTHYVAINTLEESDIVFAHLRWCCSQVKRFVEEGHLDEARQWFGFVQGCLWMRGIFSLEEMRSQDVS